MQRVDEALGTESYALLSAAIYAASNAFSLQHALLPFVTIFDFRVHQLVHQAELPLRMNKQARITLPVLPVPGFRTFSLMDGAAKLHTGNPEARVIVRRKVRARGASCRESSAKPSPLGAISAQKISPTSPLSPYEISASLGVAQISVGFGTDPRSSSFPPRPTSPGTKVYRGQDQRTRSAHSAVYASTPSCHLVVDLNLSGGLIGFLRRLVRGRVSTGVRPPDQTRESPNPPYAPLDNQRKS